MLDEVDQLASVTRPEVLDLLVLRKLRVQLVPHKASFEDQVQVIRSRRCC